MNSRTNSPRSPRGRRLPAAMWSRASASGWTPTSAPANHGGPTSGRDRTEHAESAGYLSPRPGMELRVMGEPRSIPELENLIIADRSGRPIYARSGLKMSPTWNTRSPIPAASPGSTKSRPSGWDPEAAQLQRGRGASREAKINAQKPSQGKTPVTMTAVRFLSSIPPRTELSTCCGRS